MRKYVVISKQGEEFLRKGQMWMYRNNVVNLDESIDNGEYVDILTEDDDCFIYYVCSKGSFRPTHERVEIIEIDGTALGR